MGRNALCWKTQLLARNARCSHGSTRCSSIFRCPFVVSFSLADVWIWMDAFSVTGNRPQNHGLRRMLGFVSLLDGRIDILSSIIWNVFAIAVAQQSTRDQQWETFRPKRSAESDNKPVTLLSLLLVLSWSASCTGSVASLSGAAVSYSWWWCSGLHFQFMNDEHSHAGAPDFVALCKFIIDLPWAGFLNCFYVSLNIFALLVFQHQVPSLFHISLLTLARPGEGLMQPPEISQR